MFEIIFVILILLCSFGICLPLSIMYWKDLVAQFKDKNKLLEGIIKEIAEAPDMEEADGLEESAT